MQNGSNRPHRIDPRLKGALLHPKRLGILNYLVRKPNGTGVLELSRAFRLPPRLVEYHLKVLHYADLIAQVETGQERGEADRSFVAAGGR